MMEPPEAFSYLMIWFDSEIRRCYPAELADPIGFAIRRVSAAQRQEAKAFIRMSLAEAQPGELQEMYRRSEARVFFDKEAALRHFLTDVERRL